jgi:hypothetical protein
MLARNAELHAAAFIINLDADAQKPRILDTAVFNVLLDPALCAYYAIKMPARWKLAYLGLYIHGLYRSISYQIRGQTTQLQSDADSMTRMTVKPAAFMPQTDSHMYHCLPNVRFPHDAHRLPLDG